MASDRLYRALDLLAGVAGQEVDEARQLKMEQNLRLEALQRMEEKEKADEAFRQAELKFQKDQLTEHQKQFERTEQRLTASSEAELKLREKLGGIDKDIAEIRSAAELRNAYVRNLLSAEASYGEAIDAGYSGDDMIPFIEKLRMAEQMVYGRALTPLPKKAPEELPPPTENEEEETEGGPGVFSNIMDFLSGGKYSESKKMQAIQNVATTPDTTTNPADTLYTNKSYEKWLKSQGKQ